MQHSESIAKLAAALVKVHGEIEHAHKNATNPHFKNRYADLTEVIDTTRPVLAKHGLSIVQLPGYADGVTTLESVLLHESGEWLSGVAGARMQKDDPQGVGSALTYLRRYSLAAVCGIAQEDDDGEAASRPAPRAREVVNKATGEITSEPVGVKNTNVPDAGVLDMALTFGKHSGKTWAWIMENDASYITFALDKLQPPKLPNEVREALKAAIAAKNGSDPGTQAVLLQDALNRAATLGAVTIDQSARIEGAIEGGDRDQMRIALDWVNQQMERKKLAGSGATT